jgi:hypothetical protein
MQVKGGQPISGEKTASIECSATNFMPSIKRVKIEAERAGLMEDKVNISGDSNN